MKAFAALLDRLSYTPSRNDKLRLLADYFASTPDPDRGYALAALTDGLFFRLPLRRILTDLIGSRVDPVLFDLSRDYVGRHGRDHRPDLAGGRRPRQAAAACERRRGVASGGAGGSPCPPCRLARSARCDRPLGLAQAHDRRFAGRRLGAARQDGACRVVWRAARRYRGGLARRFARLMANCSTGSRARAPGPPRKAAPPSGR